MSKDNTEDFDDNFEDGVFAIPRDIDKPRIKVRSLCNYCKKKGIKPENLTCEEIELFLDKNQ